MILLFGNNLQVEEINYEGVCTKTEKQPLENLEKNKNNNISPILISGCNIIEGYGIAVVAVVGKNSIIRQLEENKSEEKNVKIYNDKYDVTKNSRINIVFYRVLYVTIILLVLKFIYPYTWL